MANNSRATAPPDPGAATEPPVLPPFPGAGTKDQPSPLEGWFRQRLPHQHPIPYDHLTVRKSLRLYDAMELDETIAYAQKLKVSARLASGWSLSPPRDAEGDPLPGSEAVRDFVGEVIERWDRFDECLAQYLHAGTKYGFCLGEIVTREGTVAGRRSWVIEDILVRNPRFFAFDVGPTGKILDDGVLEYINPTPDGDGILSYWPPDAVARHDPQRFLRWTYAAQDSNAYSLYGRSDFLAAYRGYFLGDNLLKGMGETLDSYKHPIAIAVAAKGLTQVQREDMLSALEKGLKRKALVIPGEYLPDGVDYEKAVRFHEVTGKAADFIKGLGYLDTAKMRALLVGQLVAESGSEGSGSYALGKVHVSTFLRVMSWIGKSLGIAMCSGLFKRIVRWNLGEDAAQRAPTLVWHAAGDAEALERAQIVKALLDGGAIDPREPWIREYVAQFPRIDPEIAAMRDEESKARLEAETRPPPTAGGPPKGKAAGLAAGDPPRADDGVEAIDRAPLHEERFLDQTGIAWFVEDLIDRTEAAWRDAVGRIFDGRGGVMAWGRVAVGANGTPAISPDFSELESIGERAIVEGIVLGALDARVDVDLRLAESGGARLEVEDLAAKPKPGAKVVFDFDLEEWGRRRSVNVDARIRNAARQIRISAKALDREFEIQMRALRQKIAEERARLIDEAKAAVARARSAKGRAARQKDLRELRAKWRGVAEDLGGQQTALVESLTNAAYNRGRMALYEALPAGVVLGYLYSAILDERTTHFCRSWDGYRAPKDHPVWRRITPPNHYRCRSKIVAVLAAESTPSMLREAGKRQPRVPIPGGGFPWK